MKVNLLALDGVFDTGLATVQDVFSTANELAGMLGVDIPPFELRVTGMRKRVHTSQRLSVPVVSAPDAGRPDWIVVPALGEKMPDGLQVALQRRDVAEAAAALRSQASRGVRIAAACVGTFVLAESGLLDQRQATTTWWLASLFRQRYPAVKLDESRMLVSSGPFVTAGAALSHIDMALLLVRQASPELAATVAKYLIVDSRPSQSAYVITDHLTHSDPTVQRFERWARGRLADGFSLDEAAVAAGTSKRTLARRMQQVLGKTPLSYFQDLRVERAVHLLKTSDKSLEQIAGLVGYAEGVTLRALLRQRLGRGVRELRMVD
ncbi:AraC family transcriptional regulator [Variovorax sp. WS11]|uniref:GlxA family transcriptional regulator n=1 Tax=Variovorax sp. WS11 TaxID=1105204 RepID=UPI000D0DA5E0|nr:helix-turn-helix domain-containing protein [Variovorax sp. WS11]NDZ12089.1 helix-turn-helix domain-containing protein [Variovorax sp. WS11]PSL83730.1 AraC family transcriptional regulator [Variovorax sp. WS11]